MYEYITLAIVLSRNYTETKVAIIPRDLQYSIDKDDLVLIDDDRPWLVLHTVVIVDKLYDEEFAILHLISTTESQHDAIDYLPPKDVVRKLVREGNIPIITGKFLESSSDCIDELINWVELEDKND